MSSLRPSGRKTDITSYRPDASRIAAESSQLLDHRRRSRHTRGSFRDVSPVLL